MGIRDVDARPRRSDRVAPPPWLVVATCVPATLFVLAGLVIDGRVGDGIVFTLAVLAAGIGGACSLGLMSTMSRDVDDSSHGLLIWAAVIAVVGLGLTIGGYLRSIEPDDSSDTLTLVAVLTSILVGLAVLLGAPASGELDDVVDERPLVSADRTPSATTGRVDDTPVAMTSSTCSSASTECPLTNAST